MASQETARRIENSDILEVLARVGLVSWGLTHLLIAWLALQIAWGKSAKEGDQAGALATILEKPLGKVLLVAVIIGLAALTIWQLLEAAVGHRAVSGGERVGERLSSAGRAIAYGLLAWTAVTILLGSGKSKADEQQTLTARLLAAPGGRWLVGAAGLAILAIAVGLIWYGITDRFARHLRRTPDYVRWLGRIGYPAKGVAYGTVGVLVVAAAVTFDPAKSRGLDAALRTLAGQPYGRLLLTLVALGIGVFGLYGLAEARHREI